MAQAIFFGPVRSCEPQAIVWAASALKARRSKSGGSRVVCIAGDKNEREAAARKALEEALGEKKDAFSRWDEEIKRRETRAVSGGGGGIRGGGGGGGGGGRGPGPRPDPRDESSWNEAKQIALAFSGLLAFYIVITNGKNTLVFLLNLPKYMGLAGRKTLAFMINFPFFVLRGFKQRPSLQPSDHGSDHGLLSSSSSSTLPDRTSSAVAHVTNKWGRD